MIRLGAYCPGLCSLSRWLKLDGSKLSLGRFDWRSISLSTSVEVLTTIGIEDHLPATRTDDAEAIHLFDDQSRDLGLCLMVGFVEVPIVRAVGPEVLDMFADRDAMTCAADWHDWDAREWVYVQLAFNF